MRVKRGLFIRM